MFWWKIGQKSLPRSQFGYQAQAQGVNPDPSVL